MTIERSIHVLLVEDSPSDVLLAKDALEGDMGFHVAVTARLSETLDLLKERPFDVVLLDLGLPDSQGLDTLLKLRAGNPTVPVVVMTASDDEELALRALREGAQDYLVKTQVFEGMLARLIRYAIERKQAQVALRKAHDDLELRVQERTRELTKAIQVRDHFLATMSHELRTPSQCHYRLHCHLVDAVTGAADTRARESALHC